MVDFGKYPDLKGQWVRPPGSPNNWLRLAGPPPLTPEYRQIWEDIQADLKAGGPGNWPSTFCIHQGMPAMMGLALSGSRFVEVTTEYVPFVYWDTHKDGNETVAKMHREIDLPIGTLIRDLEKRGMLHAVVRIDGRTRTNVHLLCVHFGLIKRSVAGLDPDAVAAVRLEIGRAHV